MYQAKNFKNLLGIKGFSDIALNSHFTLYEGYVSNVNILEEKIKLMSEERIKDLKCNCKEEMSELLRRYAWEYNGMKLHEIYFDILDGEKENKTIKEMEKEILESELGKNILKTFASFENFKATFFNVATMRGIGWTALIKDEEGNLKIIWINEHNVGVLVGVKILLIVDLLEHAFIFDYALKKIDYINAFWENLNWKKIEDRNN